MYDNRTYILEATNKATGKIEVECFSNFHTAKQNAIAKYAYQKRLGGWLEFVNTLPGIHMAENEKTMVTIMTA